MKTPNFCPLMYSLLPAGKCPSEIYSIMKQVKIKPHFGDPFLDLNYEILNAMLQINHEYCIVTRR